MKTNRNFLSAADRADLVAIARDGLEENRVSRRANAILLLDRGWSFAEIAEALFIDDSTIRIWLKEFQEGGVEGLVLFDLKGGAGALSPLQIDELRAWATRVLPRSTTEVGQFIMERFGVDYGRSGLIKLMNRIGFDWRKPESAPDRIDAETQQKFIDAHEDLRNSLGPDEAVVYVDAVHPTHQAKPSGRWLPRGQRCALPAASGRDRLNLHGAIDLETGLTRIMDVQTVDAASAIALFEALERAYPAMRRIHVFLDNARYHHARAVRDWLQQPGRRIVLHFVPSYCPHLNPIERLWKVMHEHVTHNKCYAKFRDFAEAVLDSCAKPCLAGSTSSRRPSPTISASSTRRIFGSSRDAAIRTGESDGGWIIDRTKETVEQYRGIIAELERSLASMEAEGNDMPRGPKGERASSMIRIAITEKAYAALVASVNEKPKGTPQANPSGELYVFLDQTTVAGLRNLPPNDRSPMA